MSTILDEAWAAVPGLTELSAALERARAVRLPPLTRRLADVRADIEAAFIAGEPIEPLVDELATVHAAELARTEIVNGQLQIVTRGLQDRVAAEREAGVDDALAYLDGRLGEIVRDVQPLRNPLRGVDNATDALRAGGAAVKAWTALDSLARRYAELRRAQLSITSVGLNAEERRDLDQDLAAYGHFRPAPAADDSDDEEPPKSLRLGQAGFARPSSDTAPPSGWQEIAAPPNGDTDDRDPCAVLLRIIRRGLEVWVPSIDHFRAARAAGATGARAVLERTQRMTAAEFERSIGFHKVAAVPDPEEVREQALARARGERP